MREVKVFFTNGDSLVTSMSAKLTDKEIRDYYKKGKVLILLEKNKLTFTNFIIVRRYKI